MPKAFFLLLLLSFLLFTFISAVGAHPLFIPQISTFAFIEEKKSLRHTPYHTKTRLGSPAGSRAQALADKRVHPAHARGAAPPVCLLGLRCRASCQGWEQCWSFPPPSPICTALKQSKTCMHADFPILPLQECHKEHRKKSAGN